MDSKYYEMRTMLLQLNDMIKPNELAAIKYLCKDLIPLRRREEILSCVDLFTELEHRGKLKYDDVSFLEALLKDACPGRTDALEILSCYKRSYLQLRVHEPDSEIELNYHGALCNSQDLSSAFAFLVNNLGKEYLMVLRRLGVKDSILDKLLVENPHNVKEIIHKGLISWHLSKCNGTCLENIINALKGESRKDLAVKIETGTFS